MEGDAKHTPPGLLTFSFFNKKHIEGEGFLEGPKFSRRGL